MRKSKPFSLGETYPVTWVLANSSSLISAYNRMPGNSLSHIPVISASPNKPLFIANRCTFSRVFISGLLKIFFKNTLPVANPPNWTSSNLTISKTYCTSIFFKSTIHESFSSLVSFPSTRRYWPGRSNRKLSINTLPESSATWDERIFQIVSFNTTSVGKISISACKIGFLPLVLWKRVTAAILPP